MSWEMLMVLLILFCVRVPVYSGVQFPTIDFICIFVFILNCPWELNYMENNWKLFGVWRNAYACTEI